MGVNLINSRKMIGVIPARMASSRFYGKPLAKILGKEMLRWVYESSHESKILKELYVATDHEEIEAFCQREKIPFVMTSPLHKNCSERSNEVGERFKADIVIEIQGDEPTLTASDIDEFISQAVKFVDFDVVSQCTQITEEEAKDPHNVKVVLNQDSQALFFSRSPIPWNFKSQQVRYFKQIGLFFWQASSLQRFCRTPKSYLESIEDTHMLRLVENHFKIFMVPTSKFAVGVDIPEDIPEAEEYLLNHGLAKKYPDVF